MNFTKSIAQSQAASRNITTGQNFMFWSLYSWKSNWYQNKKYGDSKADYPQSPLFETCVIRREHYLRSKCFQGSAKLRCRYGLPESFTSSIIRQAQCLHVTKLSLWFAQVRSVQNNISKSALHRSVCM